MGITNSIYEFEKKALQKSGKQYQGLNWCELGCQKYIKYNIPAKLIYKKLKVNHTSFDINGKFGSIRMDLSQNIPPKFAESFDVITDYGTVEHIIKQYEIFRNIHIMCKEGGLMIHTLPLENNWKNHGLYEYSEDFFYKLSKLCNYEVKLLEILDKQEFAAPFSLLAVGLIKKDFSKFPDETVFSKLPINKGDFISMTEDYEKGGIYRVLSTVKTDLNILKWKLAGSPVN